MRIKINIVPGDRFGRLVAISPVVVGGRPGWRVRCDCGEETSAKQKDLYRKRVVSCGCKKRETILKIRPIRSRLKDGRSFHPLYDIWNAMMQRCYNEKHPRYGDYGGRGISVCDRWRRDPYAFFSDMGPKPRDGEIDRFPDNDGNYEPSNTRWATRTQQMTNTRKSVTIVCLGERLPLKLAAQRYGVPYEALRRRIACGWHPERACLTPVGAKVPTMAFVPPPGTS